MTWQLDDEGTLTIRGAGDMDKRLYYEGDRGYPWRHSDSLKKVIIEDGITSISYGAFEFCRNLTSVELPVDLREITFRAFSYCTNLGGMIIPEDVTSIGNQAFYGCESITSESRTYRQT